MAIPGRSTPSGGRPSEHQAVRLLLADDYNESCIVMQDIEGNEFDLD